VGTSNTNTKNAHELNTNLAERLQQYKFV